MPDFDPQNRTITPLAHLFIDSSQEVARHLVNSGFTPNVELLGSSYTLSCLKRASEQ
jgi:hypothetical protein